MLLRRILAGVLSCAWVATSLASSSSHQVNLSTDVISQHELMYPEIPTGTGTGATESTDHRQTKEFKPTSLFKFYPHRRAAESSTEPAEELSVEVQYEDIYYTLVFLAAVYVFGKAAAMVGMPSLVGEIVCGFLLGPPLANFVPFPEAIVLVGEIGLIMLLLEAGVDVDVAQLKETGGRALAIACTGSVLPLVTGIGLSMASGTDVRTGIAVGACFSPTSLGVASNALATGGILNTPIGQIIVASCVLDDIIALIILSIIEVLVNEEAEIYEYFIPVISAVGFLLILGWSALTWMPKVIEHKILPMFPEKRRANAAFGMMFLLLMGYLPLLYYTKASYLTGAFLAGLSFSQIHSVHKSFVNYTNNLMKWLLRIFFAATIGFQVRRRIYMLFVFTSLLLCYETVYNLTCSLTYSYNQFNWTGAYYALLGAESDCLGFHLLYLRINEITACPIFATFSGWTYTFAIQSMDT